MTGASQQPFAGKRRETASNPGSNPGSRINQVQSFNNNDKNVLKLMKVLRLLVMFTAVAVIVAGLTLPLWLDIALPYIHEIPRYISEIPGYFSKLMWYLSEFTKYVLRKIP